ncbi:hypothetical protein BSKO_11631 [Bryopsis sp. KO-2023]|nr:hypothetical protein BSKO_11631 [Bryopsis sp. KO-2023]
MWRGGYLARLNAKPATTSSFITTNVPSRRINFRNPSRQSYSASEKRTRSRDGLCWASVPDADFEVDIPDIGGDIQFFQQELGAEIDDQGVAVSFGNQDNVEEALRSGLVVFDQSHWGRFKIGGDGCLNFLHGQSTNDFKALRPGQGCDTVFATASAGTIELAACYVTEGGVLVMVSPGMVEPLLERLDKYVFPGDNVNLMDISDKCMAIGVFGPKSDEIMEEMQVTGLNNSDYGDHRLVEFQSSPTIVVKGTSVGPDGYTFIVDESVAGDLYSALVQQGGVPIGSEDWERIRVLLGRPAPGKELSEAYNPFEAGLYHAVSLDKGCYVGQEILAKVYRNNGVRQQLWGINVKSAVSVGDAITSTEGKKLGKVTSITQRVSGEDFALGYLRCKGKDGQMDMNGLVVDVSGVEGVVVGIRYAQRDFVDGIGAPAGDAPGNSEVADVEESDEQEAEKAERLKAMEERVKAFMAQQQKDQQKD